MAALLVAFGCHYVSAKIYNEVGGVVVVEAEHFDSRAAAEDETDNPHQYKLAPDELTPEEADARPGQYENARGGKYMVLLPDSGQNRNNADLQAVGPHIDFKVQINTPGEYQFYIRDAGYDGGSDSYYASILELQKAQGGPGPDWYRFTFDPTPAITDFNETLNNNDDPDSKAGWIGYSTPEINNGGGAGDREKTLWNIAKAGTYTIRIQQREDGNGVDAVALIRSNLLVPSVTVPESLVIGELDTDKDGIPDVVEIKYGLNPNDASDAAKDCNNNGVTNLDEYKSGLDPCDATPPVVVSVVGSNTFDTAKLTFSEPLDPAGAADMANYTISPSLAITAATYKNKVVALTTAKQTPGATYTVTVKGLKDFSKNLIAAGTTATLNSYVMTKNGLLKFSYWGDAAGGEPISGTPVQGLLDDPRYLAKPDLVLPVYSFNSRDAFPNDTHENYGATIEGFVTPKDSGSYRFFLSSDDASQLFLSTNETPPDPLSDATKAIAEETGCCNAFTEPAATHDEMLRTSDPIALQAGKKYAIRLTYKEGGGGDFGMVAWRKEGDATAANRLKPIPSEFLSAAVELPGPPTQVAVAPAKFTKTAKNADGTVTLEWTGGGTLEAAAAVNGPYQAVAGAKSPYTFSPSQAQLFGRIKQ